MLSVRIINLPQDCFRASCVQLNIGVIGIRLAFIMVAEQSIEV